MARFVLTLLVIGLAVYALADLAGARKEEAGGLPKWLWALVIVFVPVVGGLAWILFRRSNGTTPDRGRSSASRRTRPMAPDDDPDFLRHLDENRHRNDPPQPPTP
ncbi:MAG: PLDc N-terminal domain-containing protein [Promicromonosporaceae bacterium]|nr:PLDc N-terminal domain-containing protein [Promicromonosporaceae bacterium]